MGNEIFIKTVKKDLEEIFFKARIAIELLEEIEEKCKEGKEIGNEIDKKLYAYFSVITFEILSLAQNIKKDLTIFGSGINY